VSLLVGARPLFVLSCLGQTSDIVVFAADVEDALQELQSALKKEEKEKRRSRMSAVQRYLEMVHRDGDKRIKASETLGRVLFRGHSHRGRAIRSWAKSWLLYRRIPVSAQGKNWKTSSLLFEEAKILVWRASPKEFDRFSWKGACGRTPTTLFVPPVRLGNNYRK